MKNEPNNTRIPYRKAKMWIIASPRILVGMCKKHDVFFDCHVISQVEPVRVLYNKSSA